MTSTINNIVKKKRKKLTELYDDVEKVYDSINHEWMLLVMKQVGIETRIILTVMDNGGEVENPHVL